MNKKIYSLALTPLLFIACANSEPKQVITEQKSVVTEQIITKAEEVEPKLHPRIEAIAVATATPVEATVKFIENDNIKSQGMMHIETFMGSLKPTLQSLLKSDSTHVTAMGACSSMAMSMTNDYNKQVDNVKIRRTALKYRNPKNKPDTTDRMVMDSFVNDKKTKPLVVELADHYRVYQPLTVKQPCLLCHGARNDISPEIVKMIDRNYPKDLATGFQLGEFRGTVVAEIRK